MSTDLCVLVPSLGRPASMARLTKAWTATGAWEHATLMVIVDADDPTHLQYFNHMPPNRGWRIVVADKWRPLVPKLNLEAMRVVNEYHSLAFMGDDHVPRTEGWAARYVEELREMGTGIVFGDDLLQGERLPTHWAMTSDIVRALGAMIPAPVEHLYSDNAILNVGRAAECLRYLPDVVVEHMHPLAGKGPADAAYRWSNSPERYEADGKAFRAWLADPLGFDRAARTVRALRGLW